MIGIEQLAGAIGSPATASLFSGAAASGSPGATTGTPFSGIFQSIVAQTSSLDHQAQSAVTGLLSGQGVEVHDAMIATQKADMAFELALQVRNKAVGAYQQMMGMQF
jgi:flagellar hook-basal body complex protein FliE